MYTTGCFDSHCIHSVSPSLFLTWTLCISNHISTRGSSLFAGAQPQISHDRSAKGARATDEMALPRMAILRFFLGGSGCLDSAFAGSGVASSAGGASVESVIMSPSVVITQW